VLDEPCGSLWFRYDKRYSAWTRILKWSARRNAIEPDRLIAAPFRVRDAHIPSGLHEAVRSGYRQYRAGELGFNPVTILKPVDREYAHFFKRYLQMG